MTQFRHILTYGFAIFAMFFGSGNLVFPISIGYYSGSNWILGFSGLLLTGIILPFLGLFVIKLHRGNYYAFFSEAGIIAKWVIPFFTLSLLGSFGVIPRCITVAHGGISYLFPEIDLMHFAIVFSAISFVFCIKEQLMFKVLGKWMSPVLLLMLLILIGVGIFDASSYNAIPSEDAFSNGFLIGYQTMDLFAAFFFSAITFNQIQNSAIVPEKLVFNFAIKASIVGSVLLSVIYLGFVFLGAHYVSILTGVAPEHMLPAITKHAMGNTATLFLAVVMILSCFTTAIALNNIYARYLCRLFELDDNTYPAILMMTILVAFAISLFDFQVIAAFLGPVLEISYPALIFLTVSCIVTKEYRTTKKYIFWGMIMGMAVYYLFSS